MQSGDEEPIGDAESDDGEEMQVAADRPSKGEVGDNDFDDDDDDDDDSMDADAPRGGRRQEEEEEEDEGKDCPPRAVRTCP